jgi:hypothetical protein
MAPRLKTVATDVPSLRQWKWLLVFLAIAYVSISTVDVRVASIPLKFILLVSAFGIWWLTTAGDRRVSRPLAYAAITVGLVVPVGWLAVALFRVWADDPAQAHGLHDAAEHASRFTYVLLALPLYDWMTRRSRHRDALWLVPILILCGVTFGLLVGNIAGADYGYSGQVGPFRGAIGPTSTGVFRAFLVNHVLLIPATLYQLAAIRLLGPTMPRILVLFALGFAAYLAHARGIWLGLSVGAVALLILSLPSTRLRPFAEIALATVVGVGVVLVAAPHATRTVTAAVTRDANELSTASRIEQGPHLTSQFQRHPILGSGLGARLPDGYRRSDDTPWSFELVYLQLLFQIGVAGVVAILSSILPAARLAWRRCRRLEDEHSVAALAGMSSLIGYLFACASNPYLTTSVGMLALAVCLTLCVARSDRAEAPRRYLD